jgi:putative ABC transport system permease protein
MLLHYVKVALKVLRRRKFFTFISLFAIAFTLMVLVVVAAMMDHMLAPNPPEVYLDRALHLSLVEMRGENMTSNGEAGYTLLDRWLRDLPGVERLGITSTPRRVTSFVDGSKIVSMQRRTDADYWRVLQFRFLEGGPFGPEDDRDGSRVAVVSATTRQRFFGTEPALGRTLEADGQRFRVVGVVEDVSRYRSSARADLWVPIGSLRRESAGQELIGEYVGIFLAGSRADFPALRAEFRSRLERVPIDDPNFQSLRGQLETRYQEMARQAFDVSVLESPTRRLTLLLAGAALLFMLLPAINLVNINVSRILERASEIGVRKAFGASSAHLVGQFLIENVVLCLIGGAAGFVAAAALLEGIDRSGLVPYADFQLNGRLFLYGLGLTLFFGGLSGAYPAWRMSRLHPVQALQGEVR